MSPSFSIASSASLAGTLVSNSKTQFRRLDWRKTNRNLEYRVCSVSGASSVVENIPFPGDYFELLNQAKQAVELALKDEKQLMEIEFPTSGLASVPGKCFRVMGHDNAIASHGIHGIYRLYGVDVPNEKLLEGDDTLFVTQAVTNPGPFNGLIYDYIRLEEPSLDCV